MTSNPARKPWTRDELLLAINLYCKTQFGRIHDRNPEIIELAKYLGRTPGSVSYKLSNFASIDPSLDRKGAVNVSKLDREVWQEFFADWDKMAFDQGFITIDDSYRVLVSDEVNSLEDKSVKIISAYHKEAINLPRRFRPSQEFLRYHRENIFRL